MRTINAGLRFVLELCMLTALALWGFETQTGVVAWLLGLGAPLLAATVWGLYIAPKAVRPASDPLRLVLELALFGCAVAALLGADRPGLGIALAVAVAVHLALTFALDQRRPGVVNL